MCGHRAVSGMSAAAGRQEQQLRSWGSLCGCWGQSHVGSPARTGKIGDGKVWVARHGQSYRPRSSDGQSCRGAGMHRATGTAPRHSPRTSSTNPPTPGRLSTTGTTHALYRATRGCRCSPYRGALHIRCEDHHLQQRLFEPPSGPGVRLDTVKPGELYVTESPDAAVSHRREFRDPLWTVPERCG
jgi:hypothetical protein